MISYNELLESIEANKMKEEILAGLHQGAVEVTFEKKDGTERGMRCTLVMDNIPEEKHPKGTGNPSTSEVQKVFDLEKQEWRSFRWDSVKSFNIVEA